MSEPLLETGRERKRKKKSGLKGKFKVSTLNIQIKQSGLKVSNSKVFSSGTDKIFDYLIYPTRQSKVSSSVLGYLSNLLITMLYTTIYKRC